MGDPSTSFSSLLDIRELAGGRTEIIKESPYFSGQLQSLLRTVKIMDLPSLQVEALTAGRR